jgi:hypothetical protein
MFSQVPVRSRRPRKNVADVRRDWLEVAGHDRRDFRVRHD